MIDQVRVFYHDKQCVASSLRIYTRQLKNKKGAHGDVAVRVHILPDILIVMYQYAQ